MVFLHKTFNERTKERISWMMLLESSLLWEFNNKEESLKLNFFMTISQSNRILLCVCFKLFSAAKCFSLLFAFNEKRLGMEKISLKGGKLSSFPFSERGEGIELTLASGGNSWSPKNVITDQMRNFKIPRSFSHWINLNSGNYFCGNVWQWWECFWAFGQTDKSYFHNCCWKVLFEKLSTVKFCEGKRLNFDNSQSSRDHRNLLSFLKFLNMTSLLLPLAEWKNPFKL